jgi:glutamate dehydrogenase
LCPSKLPSRDDREAWFAEGTEAYKIFISSLLDVTDNLSLDGIEPPDAVVRLDGDDPYLVVAADKGTATFSDTANSISEARGFWLGDAFASGGSQGYDHKKMGITARGGWEAVKRHFREMDVDIQTEPFTVVGVGDMSGDVFGNGMLLSPAIKLIAAFDHRDIFIDPDPDPSMSFAERSGCSIWVGRAGRTTIPIDLQGRRYFPALVEIDHAVERGAGCARAWSMRPSRRTR